MGYFLTTEPENAVPEKSFASPKTHTPLSRLQERGHRYHSPQLGRWINRDPIGDIAFDESHLMPPSTAEKVDYLVVHLKRSLRSKPAVQAPPFDRYDERLDILSQLCQSRSQVVRDGLRSSLADPCSTSGAQREEILAYAFAVNDPVEHVDKLGLSSTSPATGVDSCVRHYSGAMWHAYLQVGPWTMGWAGSPYPESPSTKPTKCVQMSRRTSGTLPDGTTCKCATPAQLQACVKDSGNWPTGSYTLIGRNCGTWAYEVAKHCCMDTVFDAPLFAPGCSGLGCIGGPLFYGPSFGWTWPTP
jgi:hypothetical protein